MKQRFSKSTNWTRKMVRLTPDRAKKLAELERTTGLSGNLIQNQALDVYYKYIEGDL